MITDHEYQSPPPPSIHPSEEGSRQSSHQTSRSSSVSGRDSIEAVMEISGTAYIPIMTYCILYCTPSPSPFPIPEQKSITVKHSADPSQHSHIPGIIPSLSSSGMRREVHQSSPAHSSTYSAYSSTSTSVNPSPPQNPTPSSHQLSTRKPNMLIPSHLSSSASHSSSVPTKVHRVPRKPSPPIGPSPPPETQRGSPSQHPKRVWARSGCWCWCWCWFRFLGAPQG